MRRVLMIMAAAGFLAAAAPAQAALVPQVPASSWQTDGKVNAIVVGNGKIYIGGSFTPVRAPGAPAGGVVRNHLAARNVHTGALLPWNPGANDIVNALALKRPRRLRWWTLHAGARRRVSQCAGDQRQLDTLWPCAPMPTARSTSSRANRTRVYIGGTFI